MALKRYGSTDFPNAAALDGTETLNIVQDGDDVVTTTQDIADLASSSALADGDYGDVTVSGTGTVITIDAAAVTYAKMQDVSAASRLLGRGDSGSGDVQEITIGSGLAMTGTTLSASGATLTDGDYGDVTVSGSGTAISIDNDVVSDAKLRNSAALSVIGRSANSTGDPADIAASNDGEVLRRSGTSLGFGTIATAGITDAAVTNAKLADVNSQTIKGRTTASSGDVEDLTAAQASTVLQQDGMDDEACGFRGIPVVDFSADTNIIASHCGKCLRHPSTDANARVLTIQDNGTLALPVGFTFSVLNETSQAVTVAITTDTLTLIGDGGTGTITVPQHTLATFLKVTSTTWYGGGAGATS